VVHSTEVFRVECPIKTGRPYATDADIAEVVRMESSMADTLEILKHFDALPDDVLVSGKITALVLHVSERTLRRDPPIPRVHVSTQCRNYRVGDIRAFVRGAATA
jgi:hypothetical protein